jgi:hypothetical protein
MENLILLLATSFVLRLSTSRKFKNYFIADTGCSALLFSGEKRFKQTITDTGDSLYFNEFSERHITYGVICIRLKETYDLDEAMDMLSGYINKLKGPFYILHQTGLQKDVDWNSATTRTLIDYWQDADMTDWKVKGYTNGKYMAVLYVKNINELEVRKQDLFLDSFHFHAA